VANEAPTVVDNAWAEPISSSCAHNSVVATMAAGTPMTGMRIANGPTTGTASAPAVIVTRYAAPLATPAATPTDKGALAFALCVFSAVVDGSAFAASSAFSGAGLVAAGAGVASPVDAADDGAGAAVVSCANARVEVRATVTRTMKARFRMGEPIP
jgi:hypothetical protein